MGMFVLGLGLAEGLIVIPEQAMKNLTIITCLRAVTPPVIVQEVLRLLIRLGPASNIIIMS